MRSITAKDYLDLLKNKSEDRAPILKQRTCFMYLTQYFILERYVDVPGQPTVLRLESKNEKVELPPFISIEREITNEKPFSSASLATLKRQSSAD